MHEEINTIIKHCDSAVEFTAGSQQNIKKKESEHSSMSWEGLCGTKAEAMHVEMSRVHTENNKTHLFLVQFISAKNVLNVHCCSLDVFL